MSILTQRLLTQTCAVCVLAILAMNPSKAVADDKVVPSATESKAAEKVDVQTAADMLTSILSEARQKGIIKPKENESEASSDARDDATDKVTANASGAATQSSGPLSLPVSRCETAKVLDFSKFKHIKGLSDLNSPASAETPASVRAANIELAQKYLSLGLGAEARSVLANYNGEDIRLLTRLSHIVDTPEHGLSDSVFARYGDCNNSAKILSLVETLSDSPADMSGPDRRMLLTNLGKFPKELREMFSVRIATNAAENDQDAIAKAIWRKLDTLARENLTLLPIEKIDQDEYLYLNALLKKDTDFEYYRAVLKHLSEKENIFRLRALKIFSELSRDDAALSKSVEADLNDVKHLNDIGPERKAAAFELVQNRIHGGNAMEAIDTTKSYFSASDPEYIESAKRITEIVEAHLTSEDSRERFSGLNDYLYDTEFYNIAGDTTDLKYGALSAAISANLPQLHHQIIKNRSDYAETHLINLLDQAVFLTEFNAGKREFKTDIAALDMSEEMKLKLANIAIAEQNISLAQSLIPHLKEKSHKEATSLNVAIAKGDWAEASVEFASQAKDETASSDIFKVLEDGLTGGDKAPEQNWVDTLPAYLLNIDASLQKTKAYLTNG